MKWIQGKPARSAALAAQRVSTKISVYGHMSVCSVGLCWTAITMLQSTFVTEGSDGAYANLLLRVHSEKLLREAPAFLRGESSQSMLPRSPKRDRNCSSLTCLRSAPL